MRNLSGRNRVWRCAAAVAIVACAAAGCTDTLLHRIPQASLGQVFSYGVRLATDGNHLLVTYPAVGDMPWNSDTRKAYVYRLASGELRHVLGPEYEGRAHGFGFGAALRKNEAYVSSIPGNLQNNEVGAVYVYDLVSGARKRVLTTPVPGPSFGGAIAASWDRVAVQGRAGGGGYYDPLVDVVHEYEGEATLPTRTLRCPDQWKDHGFATSLGYSMGRLIVSCPLGPSTAPPGAPSSRPIPGPLLVFSPGLNAPSELGPPLPLPDAYGYELTANKGQVFAGSTHPTTGDGPGLPYSVTATGVTAPWTQWQVAHPPDAGVLAGALAVDDRELFLGCPRDPGTGKVVVLDAGTGAHLRTLEAPEGAARFGSEVAAANGYLVVTSIDEIFIYDSGPHAGDVRVHAR